MHPQVNQEMCYAKLPNHQVSTWYQMRIHSSVHVCGHHSPAKVVKDFGYKKVQKWPQFCHVVLQWCPSQQETIRGPV